MKISSDKSYLTAEQIEVFILHQEKFFVPAIASKVNLKEYSEKLLEQASLAFAVNENVIAGMIAFYCNDFNSKQAYISYFAIDDLHKGKGLGRKLLSNCIAQCQEVNMNSIKVETWAGNAAGIHLYNSLGFRVTELVNDRQNDMTARMTLIF